MRHKGWSWTIKKKLNVTGSGIRAEWKNEGFILFKWLKLRSIKIRNNRYSKSGFYNLIIKIFLLFSI